MAQYNATRHIGCCPNPLHDDKTPSCSYNPKTFSFHCFGCGYSVDILDAYMKTGLSFSEACEKLFEEAGIAHDFAERGAREAKYRYPQPEYASDKSEMLSYWAGRGISAETLAYLGVEQDLRGNTLFQYWDLNDVLVTVKVRLSRRAEKGESKCWCWPNSDVSHILYNINKINTSQPLIICSGEGDCLTAVECGFQNATSIPLGDGNTQWIGECWEWLSQFAEILLVHDNDEAGRKFAKDVSTRLGEYRVKIVDVPAVYETEDGKKYSIKDLNQLLQYEGKEAVRDAILSAKNSEIPAIIDYTDVKKFDYTEVEGFTTGFDAVDKALGKFYVGTTTILTGIASSGKSSFLSTLICQAMDQDFPCFVYSGELANPSLKQWVDFVHAGQRGLNQYENGSSVYYKIRPDVYDAINAFYKEKCFFYKDGFDQGADKLLATAESVVRRYGAKVVIFDNMTSVDLGATDENKWLKQEAFIRSIIDFGKRWQVCCIVVLHPKKMDCIRKMSLFDLQGVSASVNLAHRVLALYRTSQKDRDGVKNLRTGDWIVPPMHCSVVLDVLKDRLGSANNESIQLWYDVPSRRFYDSRENLDHKYGWDQNEYDTPLPYGCEKDKEEAEQAEVFGEVQT